MTHPEFIEPPDAVEPPVEWTWQEFRDFYGCKYADDLNKIECVNCEHSAKCFDSIADLPLERK